MTPRSKGFIAGGILSGILAVIPIINLGNCCLCLWVYLCALMAAAIHAKTSEEPVTAGQGTVTGLMVIIPTVAFYMLIGLPIAMLMGPMLLGLIASMWADPSFQAQLAEQMGAGMVQLILQHVMQSLALGVVGSGMAALGGLTGVALFEHREALPPPASPPEAYQPSYPPPAWPPRT